MKRPPQKGASGPPEPLPLFASLDSAPPARRPEPSPATVRRTARSSAARLPAGRDLKKLAEGFLRTWGAEELIRRVRVGYNPRLRTTLGRALLDENRVELNTRLLRTHPGHLVPTLAHELAHIVVYRRHGMTAPHGEQFASLMRQVGLSAEATHNLPVGHLRRKRRKYLYLHRCSQCGQALVARRALRDYCCATCGPEMQWDILRLPDSRHGKRLLKEMLRVGQSSD